ncbi:MAG TPA: hypothetical protein VJO15_08830 [Dehalococcoidia bacterium]|nr:hypothetical protein [Dehalococcoidia bacterium]
MPRYAGKAGRRKRAHTPAQVVVWLAGVPVALAFLLLLAWQSWPIALVVFLALGAFAWWEWKG